jgi:hypothetical protein
MSWLVEALVYLLCDLLGFSLERRDLGEILGRVLWGLVILVICGLALYGAIRLLGM